MSTRIKTLREEIARTLKPIQDLVAAADAANRDLTGEERSQVKTAMDAANEIRKKIDQAVSDDDLRKSLSELDGIGYNPGAGQSPGIPDSGLWLPSKQGDTLGKAFLESAQYKHMVAGAPGGQFSDKSSVRSEPFGVGGLKALVTGLSDTSAGAFVQNDSIGLQVGLGAFQRPLTLRDVVTNGSTTSDTIEYVQVTAVTNNAAPVAEATSAALPTAPGGAGALVNVAGGGYKPESGLTLVKQTTTVKTVAHWLPATKRSLSDAGQVRTLIDTFLRYGLEEELEDQIMNGDGVGENFLGINNVGGTQSQAWDTNILTTTRKARTKVRTVGRSVPTAYLLNPADWETIDLLQNNEGNYFFGGPSVLGQPRLWGLPVIESEAVTAGWGYVGDFRKCVLWDREQAAISVSDSHADFFVRNLVAILAEMRAGFGIVQPNAIVEIDLTV